MRDDWNRGSYVTRLVVTVALSLGLSAAPLPLRADDSTEPPAEMGETTDGEGSGENGAMSPEVYDAWMAYLKEQFPDLSAEELENLIGQWNSDLDIHNLPESPEPKDPTDTGGTNENSVAEE